MRLKRSGCLAAGNGWGTWIAAGGECREMSSTKSGLIEVTSRVCTEERQEMLTRKIDVAGNQPLSSKNKWKARRLCRARVTPLTSLN